MCSVGRGSLERRAGCAVCLRCRIPSGAAGPWNGIAGAEAVRVMG